MLKRDRIILIALFLLWLWAMLAYAWEALAAVADVVGFH